MFTGIVEHRGSVLSIEGADEGMTMVLDIGPLSGMELGGSIAVNGVCLTTIATDNGRLSVDVVSETLIRSTLGELRPGDPVNLERPMRADGRFDGHIVQGHVDGVGLVVRIDEEGAGRRVTVRVPRGLIRYVIDKGSLTVDGVSLTVAGVNGDEVGMALIPHTLQVTTLGLRAVGEKVNLEVDVLAKYVEKLLKAGT